MTTYYIITKCYDLRKKDLVKAIKEVSTDMDFFVVNFSKVLKIYHYQLYLTHIILYEIHGVWLVTDSQSSYYKNIFEIKKKLALEEVDRRRNLKYTY